MKKLDTQLQNTKGRFFTLNTKFGDKINSKLRNVTDFYVTVFDNNTKTERKFAKSSITSVS